ncbi:MAG: DUF2520 domain-containing protein [Actinomycetota bacterium]|nr:DUF2520 domain-containing protein [Actinomycetota bacterium]
MRELERHPDTPVVRPSAISPEVSVGVLGRGRLGSVISAGLQAAGCRASDPLPRDAELAGFDAVLLCVPDSQIAAAGRTIIPGPLVGHCSGATGLDALAPHEAFTLHPLMTVTLDDGPERLSGAGAAIAGSTSRSRRFARQLATALAMRPFELDETDRAAYHAAASMASNFLITLQAAAERLAAGTGAHRDLLVPLVRATVDNWSQLGPERALTGPVARGDEATVATQRAAVAERTPELVAMYDVLVEATRGLAERRGQPAADPTDVTAVTG